MWETVFEDTCMDVYRVSNIVGLQVRKRPAQFFAARPLEFKHEIGAIDFCGSLKAGDEVAAHGALRDGCGCFGGKAVAIGRFKTDAPAPSPAVLRFRYDDALLCLASQGR